MENKNRDEIRKIIADEVKNTGKKGLVIRRVGVPLDDEDLRDVHGGRAIISPGDQCCNGCD